MGLINRVNGITRSGHLDDCDFLSPLWPSSPLQEQAPQIVSIMITCQNYHALVSYQSDDTVPPITLPACRPSESLWCFQIIACFVGSQYPPRRYRNGLPERRDCLSACTARQSSLVQQTQSSTPVFRDGPDLSRGGDDARASVFVMANVA